MRVPSRWIRRVLIDPAIVAAVVLAIVSLPVVAIAATFVSRYFPGRWRILRIVWFLFLYLLVEAASLIGMFVLWVASGFGWKLKAPGFIAAHYRLFAWMLRLVVASAKFTFRITILDESPPARAPEAVANRPILVFCRHAGPGDSMMLMDALINRFRRRPRIVLKEFLQWDPAVDVMLHRLPSSFVPVGRKDAGAVLGAINDIAGTMDSSDAFVIFPEGANYTEKRYLRALEKLRETGRPDLAERAAELKNTLPPRSRGVMAALAAAPEPSDVFFVGHAGLETFATWGDIWRGMPMDTTVAVNTWHWPAEDIPAAHGQEKWLFDTWSAIDSWIGGRLSETGEVAFDDPDAY